MEPPGQQKIDWAELVVTPEYRGFIIKEFYYDNDETYLYLFFKCKPTVDERYEKDNTISGLGDLYIRSGINTNAGCAERDSLGNSTLQGAEIQISFPTSFHYSNSAAHRSLPELYMCYEIRRWDSVIKRFSKNVRTEDSRSIAPLVAHGKDGVEIAILLGDLQLARGSKFSIAYWEVLLPRQYVNWTTMLIK